MKLEIALTVLSMTLMSSLAWANDVCRDHAVIVVNTIAKFELGKIDDSRTEVTSSRDGESNYNIRVFAVNGNENCNYDVVTTPGVTMKLGEHACSVGFVSHRYCSSR